jgi:hypothetical protein
MQGGGGLRGLGERPISSVYGRPIPRTIYRDNGGPVIRRFMGGYSDVDAGVYDTDPYEQYSNVTTAIGPPSQLSTKPFTPNTYQDDPAIAPPSSRPTPNRPENLETSSPGSPIRQGTQPLTQRGLLNYFGVPFHPDRPTPRREYDPKNFQTPRQVYGPNNFQPYGYAEQLRSMQPSQPQQPATPLDTSGYQQEEKPAGIREWSPDIQTREIIQEYVDTVRAVAPKGQGLNYAVDAKSITDHPGGMNKFLTAVHGHPGQKGLVEDWDYIQYGEEAKNVPVPPEVLAAARNNPWTRASMKEYNKRFSRKGGGGLSSVKKSMNINGQPHKLAWINPGEASALKAMGGSGKKVDGIPAYFDEYSWSEEVSSDTGASDIGGETYVGDTGVSDIGGEGQYIEGDPYTYYQGVTSRGPTTTPTQPSEEATVYPAKGFVPATPRDDGGDSDYEQAKAKVQAREKWQNPYWNALKESGLSNDEADARLAGMGMSGLAKMEKAYKEGYSFGGPMGTMGGIGRDQAEVYAKKLKKILAGDKDIEGANIDEDESGMGMPTEEDIARWNEMGIGTMAAPSEEEIEKTGLGGIWESIKQTIGNFPAGKEPQFTTTALIEDAVQKVGGKYEAVNRDPSLIKGIINFLTPSIGHLLKAIVGGKSIGTITKRGQTFDVLEDGSVVPIEYAPSNINEGPDPEPIRRRSRGPQPVAQPSTLEPEPKLTGMAGLLAKRKPTSKSGLKHLENILASTHPGKFKNFNIG